MSKDYHRLPKQTRTRISIDEFLNSSALEISRERDKTFPEEASGPLTSQFI